MRHKISLDKRVLILGLLLISVMPTPLVASAVEKMGPAFSGAWFDPTHNGEGYVLEVLNSDTAVVYWFTYDENGNQRWFIGVGQVSGSTIEFPELLRPTGPKFGDAFDTADLVLNPAGSATFKFDDCDSGRVNYKVGDGEGGLNLVRLSSIAGVNCGTVSRPSNVILSGLSGSWFLPARNGEGLVIEVTSPGGALIYWFTYDADGKQAWYFGTGNIVERRINIPRFFSTRGPSFGPDFDPADFQLIDWGQLDLELACNQIDYQYTSDVSGSGSLSVVPLTHIEQTHCSENADLTARLDEMIDRQPDPDNFEFAFSYAATSSIAGLDWNGAAGNAHSSGPAINSDYAFKTGDVGQMYTAALALKLVEQGVLELDNSISEYLPADQISGLAVFEGQNLTASITLRQLLSHRSGLASPFRQQLPGQLTVLDILLSDLGRARTNAELLEIYAAQMHAESMPGTDLLASDINYIMVAEIIETVTGGSLDANFRQLISGPLKMSETWSLSREPAPGNIKLAAAQLDDININEIPALQSFNSGSDWASTTKDLGLFTSALFGGTLFDDGKILNEMLNPLGNFLGIADIGLGLMQRAGDCSLSDAKLQGYLGGGGYALFIPERQAFVYGFSSRQDYFALGYIDDILEAMFGPGSCADSGSWVKAETPESAGFSNEKLDQLKDFLRTTDTAAMMAIADGQVVFEYGQIGRRYASHSIRKTFVSALYGAEVDAGTINLNSTMGELGIDDVTPLSSLEKTATVRHLLQSRSGIYLPAAANASPEDFRPPRGSAIPGTAYFYNNWDFNAAGTVYEQATGNSVFDRFISDIADPIGMEDIRRKDQFYLFERLASQHPSYQFTLSTRDLARFGQLFLQNGSWQGNQVISDQWVAESTQSYSITDNPNYPGFGYMNWGIFEDGSYVGTGRGGHKVMVIPAENMVVVLRVDTYNEGTRVSSATFFEMVDQLISARQ